MKNKRNLKYFVFALFALSFFFGVKNTYADSCYQNYNASWTTNTTFNMGVNPGLNSVRKDFNNAVNIGTNYDYIKIPFYVTSISSSGVISNINLSETCSNSTGQRDNYTITYQDGSQASIDEDTEQQICNQYWTNGNATMPYQPYLQNIALRLIYNNGNVVYCDLDSNLMATCQIPKALNEFKVTGYEVNLALNGNSTILQGGFLTGFAMYCISDTETIKDDVHSIKDKLDQNNQTQTQIQNNTNEIKNDIKSDNVSGASSAADDLKNNSAFNDSTGLSGIISMPLTIVNSFSNTCQPISLNFPYFGEFQLPCLQSIINSKIPGLVSILKIVINGFLIYRVMLDIFAIVRSARNPDEDRIEVLDL